MSGRETGVVHGGVAAMPGTWIREPGEDFQTQHTFACARGDHGDCTGYVALGSHVVEITVDDGGPDTPVVTTHIDALACGCNHHQGERASELA